MAGGTAARKKAACPADTKVRPAGEGTVLESYDSIKKQELRRLRRMSATQSLKEGLALITEITKLNCHSGPRAGIQIPKSL